MAIDIKILKRFFNGKYTRSDFIIVQDLFCKPEFEVELKDNLQKHWVEFGNEDLTDVNMEHILHKIQHQIYLEERKPVKQSFIQIFQRIAAILFVPLVLGILFTYFFRNPSPVESSSEMAFAEIQCPMGVRTRFQLPDGSSGYLNSGSQLKFPVSFSANREVSLSGEAWFDVKHNETAPFYVTTQNLKIKVTGTQFNVIAYENEKNEEVVVQTGSVNVSGKSGNSHVVLEANQKANYNIENTNLTQNQILASQYTSWTNGKLVFRNENTNEVIRRLGRWYNVEMVIEDSAVLNYSFHATFVDEPLEEVLKLLAFTAPIQFKVEKREKKTDNLYQKRRVIVKLDLKRIAEFK